MSPCPILLLRPLRPPRPLPSLLPLMTTTTTTTAATTLPLQLQQKKLSYSRNHLPSDKKCRQACRPEPHELAVAWQARNISERKCFQRHPAHISSTCFIIFRDISRYHPWQPWLSLSRCIQDKSAVLRRSPFLLTANRRHRIVGPPLNHHLSRRSLKVARQTTRNDRTWG